MFSMVSPSSINSKCLKRDYNSLQTRFQDFLLKNPEYFFPEGFIQRIIIGIPNRTVFKASVPFGADRICNQSAVRVLNTFEPQKTP